MPETGTESIAATVAAARAAWARPVELVGDLSFSNRATVVRVVSDGGVTAVAKRHVDDSARRIELEALRVLPSGTRPELVAANDDVIVMTDLGDGPSLADLLLGDDVRGARNALLAWGRTLGRIASASRREPPSHRIVVAEPQREALQDLCARLDCTVPDTAWREIEAAREELLADSEHHAFVPSDACPDNTRVIGSSVVLFDFEFSGWMHAAVPASYCVVPFCSCWCLARLPDGLTEQMFAAFGDGYPEATSRSFRSSVVYAGVVQILDLLPRFAGWLDADDQPNQEGRAPSTNQQRTVQRLGWIAAQHDVMPATAAFAHELGARFRERHPSPDLPLYPAFRLP